MKLGYIILYVDDVEATLAFYERAFELPGKLVAPGEYAELSTGSTRLGFTNRLFAEKLTSVRVQGAGLSSDPAPAEIAFVTDDVDAAFARLGCHTDQAARAQALGPARRLRARQQRLSRGALHGHRLIARRFGREVEAQLEGIAEAVRGLGHPQFALTSAGGRA